MGIVYLILGTWLLVGERRAIRPLLHDGFRAPYAELADRTGGLEQAVED